MIYNVDTLTLFGKGHAHAGQNRQMGQQRRHPLA